jgi:hypothetical protein
MDFYNALEAEASIAGGISQRLYTAMVLETSAVKAHLK